MVRCRGVGEGGGEGTRGQEWRDLAPCDTSNNAFLKLNINMIIYHVTLIKINAVGIVKPLRKHIF